MSVKAFYFSVDVDWVPGSQVALEGILDLCDELSLKATFFTAGGFVRSYPAHMREVLRRGHEVGSHGLDHGRYEYENYRTASLDDQRKWLRVTTELIEDRLGIRPVSFRAPYLWVSETTFKALEELNYRFDSSVPARRYDAGLGRLKHQTQYFRAPRDPYYPSSENLAMRGDGPILEVPPSTFALPMNMTSIRLFGPHMAARAAHAVWKRAESLVFYIHPGEFVKPEDQIMPSGRPLRHRRGFGPHFLHSLRKFIELLSSQPYKSLRIDQARESNEVLNCGARDPMTHRNPKREMIDQ